MSALRSRAELDAEPRLMQFVIERAAHDDSIDLPLPFVVWVEPWPMRGNYCDAITYRLPKSEVMRVRSAAGLPPKPPDARPSSVCEHDGHLIE